MTIIYPFDSRPVSRPDNLINEFGTIVADELLGPAMLEEDLLGQRFANCQRFLVREAYRVVDSSGDVSDMAHVFEAIAAERQRRSPSLCP